MSDFFDPTNWQHWSVLALGFAFLQVGYWVSEVEGQTYRSTIIRLGHSQLKHSQLGRPRRERSRRERSRRERSRLTPPSPVQGKSPSRRKQRATPTPQPRSGRARAMARPMVRPMAPSIASSIASSVAPPGRSPRRLPPSLARRKPSPQPHRTISMR